MGERREEPLLKASPVGLSFSVCLCYYQRSDGTSPKNMCIIKCVLVTHFRFSNCVLLTQMHLVVFGWCVCLLSLSLYHIEAATPVEVIFLNVIIKFHRHVIKMPWYIKKKKKPEYIIFQWALLFLFSLLRREVGKSPHLNTPSWNWDLVRAVEVRL